MRSISGNLAAAQKASVRPPHLLVSVSDRHAAVVAADGSLIRARFDGTTLYRSRVTTPTSGSTYSSWTTWTPPITPKANLIAFAKAGATLWAFIVNNATQTQVYAATSADNGATWGAFALQFTHISTVKQLAAAGKSDGNVVVAIINATDALDAQRWNGATWG